MITDVEAWLRAIVAGAARSDPIVVSAASATVGAAARNAGAGGLSVTPALAVTDGSSRLVAVTATVRGVGTVAGAT